MNNDLASAAIEAALAADWEKAADINKDILKDSPDDIDTLNRLGRAYIELGDAKKATLTFKKVLKLDKYNQISQKNLQRIDGLDKRKKSTNNHSAHPPSVVCDFIEEPGKTKIVALVNVATPKMIASLRPATIILLKPKRHTVVICLDDQEETYVGALPDDLGHRLEVLIRGGNTYAGFIKSAAKSSVTVFLKEVTKNTKLKNVSSFASFIGDRLPPAVEEEIDKEAVKKSAKPGGEEAKDDEDDMFSKKITELHGDEEPPDN